MVVRVVRLLVKPVIDSMRHVSVLGFALGLGEREQLL